MACDWWIFCNLILGQAQGFVGFQAWSWGQARARVFFLGSGFKSIVRGRVFLDLYPTLSALAEDMGLVASTHMASHKCVQL